jgi:hypothetical protein
MGLFDYLVGGREQRRCDVETEPVGWVERSETHHLPLRHARAATNYRRNFICGGSFFFTANLAERRLRLLVDDIVSAKDDGFRCRLTNPGELQSRPPRER